MAAGSEAENGCPMAAYIESAAVTANDAADGVPKVFAGKPSVSCAAVARGFREMKEGTSDNITLLKSV